LPSSVTVVQGSETKCNAPSLPDAARSQEVSPAAGDGSGYHRAVAYSTNSTETKKGPHAGLYERIVGVGWGDLDEPVRRFHTYRGELRGAGKFAVRRGTGLAVRLLARLLGLPEAGEAAALRLSVKTLEDGGERWRRTFAGKDFITEQHAYAETLLAERTGPFEMHFSLTAEGGALAYRQVGAALRAGRLRVRLPRRLAPRIEAWERARGDGVDVSVRVTSPLVGLLIEYEGLVKTEETEDASLMKEEAG
jgi:hypothetical protein